MGDHHAVVSARQIENADLWSAIRGLRLMQKSPSELSEIEKAHKKIDAFASRVIVEAVRQVRVVKAYL